MRLPDPINNIGQPGYSSVELASIQPVMQDSMPNTKVISTTTGEQYFTQVLSYGDLLKDEYGYLNQCIMSAIRDGEGLDVWMPHLETEGLIGFEPVITKHTESNVSYQFTGGRLPKVGRIAQFSNSKKVYMITGVNVINNVVYIDFQPTLRQQTTANTTIKFSDILFSMEFTDRAQPIQVTAFTSDGFYAEGVSLSLRESV